MIFRTIFVKKDNNKTRKRHCNYSFKVFLDIDVKKDDAFEVLIYAAEGFLSKRYAGIGTVENNIVSIQIQDFPEIKQRRFEKEMGIFVCRLREKTGTFYTYKIE